MSDPGRPNGWPTTWSKMYVNRTRVQFVWGVGLKRGKEKKKSEDGKLIEFPLDLTFLGGVSVSE